MDKTVWVKEPHLDWLEDNKIKYIVRETTISPVTLQPLPWKVALNDRDYIMFMLRWS